jgi:hypothetical protein
MLHRTLMAAVLVYGGAAAAQDAPARPPAPAPLAAPLGGLHGLPGDDVLMFISTELGGRGIVKGAPYSATAVSETRQTLPDGNRIVRSTTTRLFRDAQGRTRQEQGQGVVFINDVVGGKRLLLNTAKRSARELPLRSALAVPPTPPTPPTPPAPATPAARPAPPAPPAPPATMSGDEAQGWAEAMRQWAREFSARVRGEAVAIERDVDVVVRRDDGSPNARPGGTSERVEVIRFGEARAPLPPAPPPVPLFAPRGPGTTVPLGSRDFDGVRADGTKTTWTIPAGQIGNEKPIEIVSERWYAPDLMLVVLSRHADPRSGERVYRLEGLKREEPPADLFRVPADYEVRPAPAERRTERK